MSDFTIRIAKRKDLPAISRFGTPIVKSLWFYSREHTARNVYEMSVKDLKNTMENYTGNLIIAVAKDGKIVGMVAHNDEHGHVDWLDWILVDQNFRKKGVGRALVNYAIKDAKKRGLHKIWTDCNTKNKPAIKFFSGMGFRKVGILKQHAFRQDEILWEKLIK